MKTLPIISNLSLALFLAVLLAPFARPADGEEPVWQDPVVVRQGEQEYELLTEEDADDLRQKQREKAESAARNADPDPGWIGDCYYYADGGYYHKDGVYWCPDMKTHYVYEEGCWYLANGGILTETGVYYPVVAAPDGILGLPWRLAAVATALIAGPPQDPGTPPEKPVRVVIEVRSSSGR